jgi:hypothetical protein
MGRDKGKEFYFSIARRLLWLSRTPIANAVRAG